MDVRSAFVNQSYLQARQAAAPAPQPEGGAETFARLAQNVTATLDRGETTARAALAGQADPHALVEALASSSLAVETAVTLRDRVVEAYQEILRMPV